MKVLLDNGHGENTPGKRSPKWSDGSQLFEWEYAREIAKGVYNQLRAKGIDAELRAFKYARATVVHGGERKSGGRSDGRNAPRLGGKAK